MTVVDRNEQTRRRLIGTLFAGNAIGATAYIGIATVSTLVAEEITGSTSVSGLAPTLGTLGVAAGAGVLSWFSARLGRRPAFAAGFLLGVVGSALAVVALAISSLLILLLGMFVMGFGRSATQLARYAAGDMRPQSERAKAIGIIVWASTIGAIVGPLLIGPMGSFALAAGFNEYVGPISLAVIGFALGAVLLLIALRPDPLTLAVDTGESADQPADRLPVLLALRTVQCSGTAIIISQVVMVLVMVMTPIHIRDNGGTLSQVGFVMMAHAVGMFAIAPLTGWLVARYGASRMIGAAVVTFIASCGLACTATTASIPILAVSMFGVGIAWNFGFVAGSTMLQDGLAMHNRLKIQGVADAAAWVSSGVAAAASGVVLDFTSYGTLAVFGALIALIPLIPMSRLRLPRPSSVPL